MSSRHTITARLITRDDTLPEDDTPAPPETPADAEAEAPDAPNDDATGYDISGIAVPFGEEFAAWYYTETFSPDCVFDGLDQAKLYWQHADAIGKVTGSSTEAAGLLIHASISRTPRGDEAATLVRDGVIDSLSIGFDGIASTVEVRDDGTELVTWTHVRIREVSLVSFPAYATATLTEVRHHQQKAATMPHNNAPALTRADLDSFRSEMGEQLRATQAQIATLGDTRSTAPSQFRSFGEFIRAYHTGDSAARNLHNAWMESANAVPLHDTRAYDGTVLADTIARDPWVGDSIRLIDKGRKVINSFQTAPLPPTGSQIEHGVLESNTVVVGQQEKEGDTLDKGAVKVGSDTARVGTYGGWSELSFQSVERADISVLDLTRTAQLIAYAQQTEAEVRAVLTETVADNIASGHHLDGVSLTTAADWIAMMIDAHDAYDDAALPINGLFLSKAQFKKLFTLADGNDRLQFQVFGTGSNVVGDLTLPGTEGMEGQLASTRVRLLPGQPDDFATFYNEQAITTWESAGAPLALEDMNVTNLTRSYSVYGYLAAAAVIPDAILPVSF